MYLPRSTRTCSNHISRIFSLFGVPFWPPVEANVEINDRFGFGITKNIEINLRLIPIGQFEFYPYLSRQMEYIDLKNKDLFVFGRLPIPKNIDIDF